MVKVPEKINIGGAQRIGLLQVDERTEFEQRFTAVVERIRPGGTSRNQAARDLGSGYATMKCPWIPREVMSQYSVKPNRDKNY